MADHVPEEVYQRALDAELRRRLDAIGAGCDDDALGRFDARDWTLIGMGFVVLPLLAVWWFA